MGFYVANEYQVVAGASRRRQAKPGVWRRLVRRNFSEGGNALAKPQAHLEKSRLGFFPYYRPRAGFFASKTLESHCKIESTPAKTASGRSVWPSRDPIGEVGSVANVALSSESRTITENAMAVSRRVNAILKQLETYASSTGISFDQQVLVELRNKIDLELQTELYEQGISTDSIPKPLVNHLFRFVENNPISNIDSYGLYCIRFSRRCAFCVAPDCPQPPYRPPLPGHCPPPSRDDDPPSHPSTGPIVCIRCNMG